MNLGRTELRSFLANLRGILQITAAHRLLFAGALALMLVVAGIETLELAMLMPLIDAFVNSATPGFLTGPITRLLARVGLPATMGVLLAVFIGVALARSLGGIAQTALTERIRRRIHVDLTLDCYRNLMRVAYSFYHRVRSSDLSIMSTYSGFASQSAFDLLTMLSQLLLLAGYLAFLGFLSWQLSLLIVGLFGLAALLFSRLTLMTHRIAGRLTTLKNDNWHSMAEALQSIKVVKAFANEPYEIGRYARLLREHERLSFALNLRLAVARHLKPPINYLILAAVVIFASQVLHTPFAVVSVYLLTLLKFLMQGQQSLDFVNQVTTRLPPANQALALRRTDDKPYLIDGTREFDGEFAAITFERVGFAYLPGKPVLAGIDLVIPRQTTVAVVGRSGSGKTTLADLLLRFYDPTAGRILFDGADLREFRLASYLARVAVVSQDIYIFNDTVAENIRYGRLDATPDEIRAAAELAHAGEFVDRLPQGYATRLGDRGVRLSGGQRQRIALARALLRRAPILILDEATSALDAESEKMIQQAINSLSRRKTILIIAHRLSTVIAADRICVLDQGRMVESGTHQELLARGSHYHRYYSLQSA